MGRGCYVHVPFCAGGKCPYCAFYSVPYRSELADKFILALVEEARREGFAEIDTLYFGGGTPTSLSANQLERLLSKLLPIMRLRDNAEITFEAGPETLDDEKLAILRNQGAGRLSIGVQSFSEGILETLGRRHSVESANRAIRSALGHGFEVSIDLMYGIPGQSMADWEESLGAAVSAGVDHVSLYCLSFEENTPFEALLIDGKLAPINDEEESAMFFRAVEFLSAEGFARYELSNFARKGKVSRHNRNYWLGGGYYGLGPSAHAYYPGPKYWIRGGNTPNIEDYIGKLSEGESPRLFEEKLTPTQLVEEFVMLRLRLAEGFSIDDTQEALPQIGGEFLFEALRSPIERGFLKMESGRVFIPEEMLFVADSCIVEAFRAVEKALSNKKPSNTQFEGFAEKEDDSL
ncbi:MAG TPA: radical SAM family heme chaperone HemW [candidate division Zixibacteria bacterium]|nr:radical SAM family heme chaperone HemW [candidate division Zixibacteria bacterium]